MNSADRPSLSLAQILRSTLHRVEQSAEFSPDDPALQEFKRSILRILGEIHARREPSLNQSDPHPEKARPRPLLVILKGGRRDHLGKK
ncbi:MAG: hypothetical protein JOZ83_02080 [Silvibacterium sp.]|nr:hypothetical protein [Silvibacterium sp.]